MAPYAHLFGPIRSRRFGRSLGVDLQRPSTKVCTLNCVFCQLGPTACTTLERHPDVPIAAVLAECDAWLQADGKADFITLAGSGEPTLHPDFGQVLAWVRDRTTIRSLLLSNGTLFTYPAVRRDAARADVVKVSLNAWDAASFRRISRPHPSLRFSEILDSYRRFRDEYAGELVVEVFIVPGENDRPEQVAAIAELLKPVRPDRIQLNSVVRPPAESHVAAVPEATLAELARLFSPAAETAAVAPTSEIDLRPHPLLAASEEMAQIVQRHPATAAALAATLGLTEEAVMSALRELSAANRITLIQVDGAWQAGPRR